jgi:hypothetical protein
MKIKIGRFENGGSQATRVQDGMDSNHEDLDVSRNLVWGGSGGRLVQWK